MPVPAMAEATKSKGTLPVPRSKVPTRMNTRQPSRVRSVPKRRPSRGASIAKRPRQTIGKVVSRLAAPGDSPVDAMISGSTTDRLENTGRRLKAMSTTLSASSRRLPGVGAGVGNGAGVRSHSASISKSETLIAAFLPSQDQRGGVLPATTPAPRTSSLISSSNCPRASTS